MGNQRPAIPRPLRRQVEVEAGHRCAIPTCRATSGLEINHIEPWARVREHSFENLILLCANCHSRVTRREIDELSVKAYKANLSILTSRYGDLERRVIEEFVQHPEKVDISIDVSHAFLLSYLVADGLLLFLGPADNAFTWSMQEEETPSELSVPPEMFFGPALWKLTKEGEKFILQIRNARTIE